MTEKRGLLWVTQLVIEGSTITKPAHIEFHTVRTNLMGTGEFTQFLTFQNHPVAHTHLILLGHCDVSGCQDQQQ